MKIGPFPGDRILNQTLVNQQSPKEKNFTISVQYPQQPNPKLNITSLNVTLAQDGGDSYVVILNGGIGHSFVNLFIGAKMATKFSFNCDIFGFNNY